MRPCFKVPACVHLLVDLGSIKTQTSPYECEYELQEPIYRVHKKKHQPQVQIINDNRRVTCTRCSYVSGEINIRMYVYVNWEWDRCCCVAHHSQQYPVRERRIVNNNVGTADWCFSRKAYSAAEGRIIWTQFWFLIEIWNISTFQSKRCIFYICMAFQ